MRIITSRSKVYIQRVLDAAYLALAGSLAGLALWTTGMMVFDTSPHPLVKLVFMLIGAVLFAFGGRVLPIHFHKDAPKAQ